MSHCYECKHGTPIYQSGNQYDCPQSSALRHPIYAFGPGNSSASWGINISTSSSNASWIFLDHIIQVYSPTTPFNLQTYINPNTQNTTCLNSDPNIYGGTGNIESVYLSLEGLNNSVYTVANGCFDAQSALGTQAMSTYCYSDVINGLNTVNALFGWPQNFTTNMTLVDMLQNIANYQNGDRYNVMTQLCGCKKGPCYCEVCTHWNNGYPPANCIYSTINIQLCLDSAAADPCCVKPQSLKKAEFGECAQTLSRYLLSDDGAEIRVNKVRYESELGNYSLGDCVFDPKNEKWLCCTVDGQNDMLDKTIACRIVNDKFINYGGIWRSCEKQPMLWECVSGVGSCDNFTPLSVGYVGSFRSMSQVDDYYEDVEPMLNISETHFELPLRPVELSVVQSDNGWCTSKSHNYIYEPKYRLLVTPTPTVVVAKVVGGSGIGCCIALKCPDKGKGCKCKRYTVQGSGIVTCKCEGSCGDKHVGIGHQQIEAISFNGLIDGIAQTYTGITVNNTMKFSKIVSVVREYLALNEGTSITLFDITVGVTPYPVEDSKINCTCKQTIYGKYKTESECLDNKIAPIGFHYMSDGTLMSDAEHNKVYDSPNSSSPSTSSSTSSSYTPSPNTSLSSSRTSATPSSNSSSSSSSSSSSESSGYL